MADGPCSLIKVPLILSVMNKSKVYGKKMQEVSAKYLKANLKLFKATEEDYEQNIQMIFDDAQSLYAMGGYMIEGNLDAAMSLASEVATAVRDEIPTAIYNYLCKETIDQE
jgi:polyhydroxyalkanoate synthesis regulator protein